MCSNVHFLLIVTTVLFGTCFARMFVAVHRRTGRVSFGRRGGGGGGAGVSCPNIFSHCLHENLVGFARILPDFLPENGYLKNYTGAV